jgi:hypothetical protein
MLIWLTVRAASPRRIVGAYRSCCAKDCLFTLTISFFFFVIKYGRRSQIVSRTEERKDQLRKAFEPRELFCEEHLQSSKPQLRVAITRRWTRSDPKSATSIMHVAVVALTMTSPWPQCECGSLLAMRVSCPCIAGAIVAVALAITRFLINWSGLRG